MPDPYETLGVAKGSDIAEVKKAYRKLARQLHPDLHPGDKHAEERFKTVTAAYDFLSDADRKTQFDKGEIDAEGQPRAQRTYYRTYADGGFGSRYQDPEEFIRDSENMDIFSDLLRGMRRDARKMRGADVRATLAVDFIDAVRGATREVVFPDGKRLKVQIPAGSDDGRVLRLRGQGQPGMAGGPAGDALVELRVTPHATFTRQGNDILSELPVSLPEAVLGGRAEVATVDGPVTLTIPEGANTGMKLRVRGKGVPIDGGGRGDQFVTLKVVLPEAPDDDLRRLVRDWAERHPYKVR